MTMISTESSHAPAWWTNRLARTASIRPVACEATPFVWQNRLYRVESYPRYFDFPGVRPDYRFFEDEIRVRDVASGQVVSVPQREPVGCQRPRAGRIRRTAD
jgi:alpha-L-fucosidase